MGHRSRVGFPCKTLARPIFGPQSPQKSTQPSAFVAASEDQVPDKDSTPAEVVDAEPRTEPASCAVRQVKGDLHFRHSASSVALRPTGFSAVASVQSRNLVVWAALDFHNVLRGRTVVRENPA